MRVENSTCSYSPGKAGRGRGGGAGDTRREQGRTSGRAEMRLRPPGPPLEIFILRKSPTQPVWAE